MSDYSKDLEWWKNEEVLSPSEDGRIVASKKSLDIDFEESPAGDIFASEGIDGVDFSDEEVKIEAGDSDVVMFARNLVNSGMMRGSILSAVSSKFCKETIEAEAGSLSEVLSMEGLAGCVAVDARGYGDCKKAFDIAKSSPNSSSIKYVIGCSCGQEELPVESGLDQDVDAELNSVDTFMAMDTGYKAAEVATHCSTTMLRVIKDASELTDVDVQSAVSGLVGTGAISEKVAGEIVTSELTNKEKISASFQYVASAGDDSAKYKEEVDASEFMIETVSNDIDVDADLGDFDFDMNPAAPCGIFAGADEIELDDATEHEADLDVDPYGDLVIE